MDGERRRFGDPGAIPDEFSWASLVKLDGAELENHNVDVKAEIYEGLLEKNAQDVKSSSISITFLIFSDNHL